MTLQNLKSKLEDNLQLVNILIDMDLELPTTIDQMWIDGILKELEILKDLLKKG